MAPADLMSALESTVYPLPLLLSSPDHRPLVAVAAFAQAALPGLAPANGKLMFCGDIATTGVLPGLVQLINQSFHQTVVAHKSRVLTSLVIGRARTFRVPHML